MVKAWEQSVAGLERAPLPKADDASIALAFGAGGARGIALVHVIRAFGDLGVRPAAVSGTSIGSIMGAAMCAGMDADDILAFIDERLHDRMNLVRGLFDIVPPNLSTFFADGGFRVGELNLERILGPFLPRQVGDTFEALDTPLHVVATDYYGQNDRVFTAGPLRPALAASACIPAVFLPVQIDGTYYTDGSATNPCPMDVLQDKATHVLAIDVAGGSYGNPSAKPSQVDVVYGANQLMQRTMASQMAALYPSTVLLRADVARFRPLDFLKSNEILAQSAPLYEETKLALEAMLG